MTSKLKQDIEQSASALREILPADFKPRALVILGSGLGGLADEIDAVASINYGDIPLWASSTAIGHSGRLVCGDLEGTPVLAMQGRLHYYEGYTMQQVTFPVRVARELGASTLVVTNAAGGLNPAFKPGDLMLIRDHINLVGWGGANPLIGPNDEEMGPRFLPMDNTYDSDLAALSRQVADEVDMELREGVYVNIPGPTFETNAELRFLRLMGGDAVGMSTVPEVLVARHGGMKVIGISCITNMAVADMKDKVNHEEVLAVAAQARPLFMALVRGIARGL